MDYNYGRMKLLHALTKGEKGIVADFKRSAAFIQRVGGLG